MHSCYEAGPFGYGLHRELVALGIRNLVVQPVCLDEQHSHHLLPITKHSNVRLRTALVELAWRLVVWQRDCALVKKWGHIFGNPKATKAAKKKAIVAIARQMAVNLWRWRTGRVQLEHFGWTMVSTGA